MIPNQVLQNTVEGLKEICRMNMCVFDSDGKSLASTVSDSVKYESNASVFAQSEGESQKIMGCYYYKIHDESSLEYVLMIEGSGEEAHLVGKMACFQMQNMVVAYKERYDRDNFIKNLLLDNLLLVDIFNRSQKLMIENSRPRAVILLESHPEKNVNIIDSVKKLVKTDAGDFVTAVDEHNIIVVKELKGDDDYAALNDTSNSIYQTITEQENVQLHIAYGTIVAELKDVSRSYKEAKMALEIGKIFYEDRNVVAYNKLGIGRLIYQLPVSLCRMFIKEIFAGKAPDTLDEDTLTTINKFFENNLNISQTSRELYIHRNTLVYRLDKLEQQTGIDLRLFDDAITFKIALMVVKYMNYIEKMENK